MYVNQEVHDFECCRDKALHFFKYRCVHPKHDFTKAYFAFYTTKSLSLRFLQQNFIIMSFFVKAHICNSYFFDVSVFCETK